MELLIPVSVIDNFHFLRPLWLLALIPVLLFFFAMWRVNSVVTAWDKAIDKNLLPYLLDRSKNASQRTPLILLFAAWSLSILALAGPVWEQLPQPVQKKEVVATVVKTKPNKKKKKKVIQEIMGDDLKESKEMLDEII